MGLLYVPHIRGLRKCFSCGVRLIALSFASSRTIRVAAPVRTSFLFTFKPNGIPPDDLAAGGSPLIRGWAFGSLLPLGRCVSADVVCFRFWRAHSEKWGGWTAGRFWV